LTLPLALLAALTRGVGVECQENIVAPDFLPARNAGISKEEALATIHVIAADGSVLRGLDALTLLYGLVGLGWVMALAKLPGLSAAAELVYKLLSKNRTGLSSGLDGLLSLSRVAATERGEGSCAEDAECRGAYATPAPAPEPAAAASSASAAQPAAAPAAAEVHGSALDRGHILGVYYSARDERGAGLRAAAVDVVSGALLSREARFPLDWDASAGGPSVDSVIEGTKALCAELGWSGVVGVGLPGLLRQPHEAARPPPLDAPPATDLAQAALAKRHARVQTEAALEEGVERPTLVMTGAEANGFGELLYGAAKGERGLVLMLTLSRGMGVALFEDGMLLRHVETAEHTWSWNLSASGRGGVSQPPLPARDTAAGDPAWAAWAARVQPYLARLDAAFAPELVVVGGAAGEVASQWLPLLDPSAVRARVAAGALGSAAGILGSAGGGRLQMTLRDDLSRLRGAIGRSAGASPQLLSRSEVRAVFDSFDSDGSGSLSRAEVAAAVRSLGVRLPPDELREVCAELDVSGNDSITLPEFEAWWADLVLSSPVTYVHTEAEFDSILDEEATSGRLIVLQIGFTFCKPCKAFEPKFKAFAQHYTSCRFLRVNGNENDDMVRLGRDRLALKSSPSFFFFQNSMEVHRHSGASEEKLQVALSVHAPATAPLLVTDAGVEVFASKPKKVQAPEAAVAR